jgi:hypothetical protein
LSELEGLDQVRHGDQVLLHQWIAFNSLYGQWDHIGREPSPDRQSWQAFLQRIYHLDQAQHLVGMLQDHKPLVLCIIEDEYLTQFFWREPTVETAGKARARRFRVQSWYVEGRWSDVLIELIDHVYLLRCQLAHGAASYGSRLNRDSVKHCTCLMNHFFLAALKVWIDFGADEDWGPMCYPPTTLPRNGVAAAGRQRR